MADSTKLTEHMAIASNLYEYLCNTDRSTWPKFFVVFDFTLIVRRLGKSNLKTILCST